MPWHRTSAITAAIASGIGLLLCTVPAAAQAPSELSPSSALATSVPFDIQPRVERASFDLRQPTLHQLFDAIAQAYGVRLLYDRDLGQLPVSSNFRLQDATWQEALAAAGSISRTFVSPIDPQTGIVAADSAEKRGRYERVILGSYHMADLVTPQQLTEISVALRNIVDLRRVTQDSRSNWITVRGRTRQVAAAGQFLQTLQKATGEVMLEVDIWEIDRRRARELGILPPQSFQLLYLGEDGASGRVPLSDLARTGSFYGVRLPNLAAFLNSSSSLVRSHQVVHLRASDSQPARFLVGQRIPVVSTVLSSAILADGSSGEQLPGSEGFIPGIQYQDVGVVVQATPYLHAERELTLKLDLAVRNLGPVAPNGLPTFTNREFTGQIRLRDGESFLLSGILSRADQASVTGYPWLSRIPLLGLLFGKHNKQQDETELIIMVRPRTVRLGPAEEFASRAIFFGRELTGLPAVTEAPPQPGAPPQPRVPPQPGVAPEPGTPVPGVFPPAGVFPPGVLPPGLPQPGVTPRPVQPQVEEPEPPPPEPEEPAQN